MDWELLDVASFSFESEDEEESVGEAQLEAFAVIDLFHASLYCNHPKHLGYGIASGASIMVAAAVGVVGMIVLAPVAGAAAGAKQAGILGVPVGLVGGAVAGVVGGTVGLVGGAVQGVTRIVRGAAATPGAIMEPTRGKWWNDVEGKWILTNLDKEQKALLDIPEDDSDLVDADESTKTKPPGTVTTSKVVDTSYYDALEIVPDAEPPKIKRQYYLLARKYHPDRVGKNDKVSAEKFKDIAEAYQVLSDPELRHTYNVEGKEGLSADKSDVAAGPSHVDPAILFAFLFGSDQFGDYVGRLAMATSAIVADSSKTTGQKEARIVQQRRVTRLAIKLAERLAIWTEEDYDGAKAIWKSAATDLGQASYGTELVTLIGKIYSLSAHQFLGATDSGVGMPSIAKWTKV